MRPLYSDAQTAIRCSSSHAGLWFDRYFAGFLDGARKPDDKNKAEKDQWSRNKADWIKSNAQQVGDKILIDALIARRRQLLETINGTSLTMATDWHFVTGMGNNHPVENGFAWHPTLGVPYLTGAAGKGLLRTWCEVWAENFNAEMIQRWFGDTNQSGELMFFDAIPTQPVQLKADIMTPHYGKWYELGDQGPKPDGSNVPADWHDPLPVQFLVVDKGQAFQFSVVKRPHSDILLGDVTKALAEALEWIGAGAKKAAGYGRFSEDPQAKGEREKDEQEGRDREAEEQRLQKLDAMPEHERLLEESRYALDKLAPSLCLDDRAYGELRSIINRLLEAAANWSEQERKEAVEWVNAILDQYGWRHPDFNAAKKKKWEKKMRQRLEGMN